ncbi:MAG TPA: hypothetical protein VEK11_03305 [Thermoanaerobaculia bacterium]|nr:hypothetical protein [Thermoanaerobaculia bacterium]
MKSSKLFFALFATVALLPAVAADAAGSIDMDDPRRVVGRENDVRIDAQLIHDTVAPGTPIGVTYQIQNLSAFPVAIADKVANASYDPDTQTITLSLGAEVPDDGKMPQVTTIQPGETKVLRAGATPTLNAAATRTSFGASPRFVQVKVSILRDLTPFHALIHAPQPKGGTVLSDAQFEQWFESNDTIFLNTVPVRFAPRSRAHMNGADRRSPDASRSY